MFNLTMCGLNLISHSIIFCILHKQKIPKFWPKNWYLTNKVAPVTDPAWEREPKMIFHVKCQHCRVMLYKQSKHTCSQGSGAHLRTPEALGFLRLKYALFHILETPFLLLVIPSLAPKTDKNRTLHCTSINLRYFKEIFLCYYTIWGENCFF